MRKRPLTDRNDIKFDSLTARLVIETVSQFSQAAPVFVARGTKTHDGDIPELLQEIRTYFPVYVSTNPEQVFFTGDGFRRIGDLDGHMDGKALISSVPTPTKQYLQSMDGIEQTDQMVGEMMTSIFTHFGMTARQFDLPHILVGHWQVGGAYVSETQQLIGRDIEISTDQILSAHPDLCCLGHIHHPQQIGKHPIFYSGSSYRKDFGELSEKGFYIHELDGSGLQGSEFIQAPTRKLVKLDHDFTKSEGIEDLDAILYSHAQETLQGAHLRVEFRLWQDQREQVNKEQIESFFLSAGCESVDIHIVSVPLQNVRAGRVLQVERLRDKIEARAEIVGDSVDESVLEKCDVIEEEARETIIKKAKEAA